MRTHYHDHFELCYVAEWRGWFMIDGLLYDARRRCVLDEAG